MPLPDSFRRLRTTDDSRLIIKELKYNVIYLLKTNSEKKVLSMFGKIDSKGGTNFTDWRQALFSLRFFDEARRKQQLSYEIYQNKTIPAESSLSCPHCGSTNVQERGKYNRALDEAGAPAAICINCGNHFAGE